MEQNWTIKRVLDWTTNDFNERQMPSARLEAELLLCHLLDVERLYLYTHFDRPLHQDELTQFRALVARRRRGECNAHITGIKEFWSLSFEVNPLVLVPRPDTETLVQAAVDVCQDGMTVLDLCTGSGCVAVAVASECPGVTVHATDISPEALAVAARNVAKHDLSQRITLFEGDLFEALPPQNRYDVIVANPPYVRATELPELSIEVQQEPQLALLGGGADGLDITRRLLGQVKTFANKGASIFIELDDTQTVRVATELGPELLGRQGTTIADLAGKNRVVAFVDL
ncbi:MAG: peptide chain release factor N(5)-glutamine methyltransferase [Deltaproteobacteria bacterium]|nr:peptide chain release factor N(5)-glutamine methyltransferase [Deltaproteobacteria bacterium]